MFNQGGFRSLPTVTKNLLIINVLLFAASFLLEKQGIDLTEKLGLHYFKAPLFKPYQFVTYLFMHGNFMHLFFNMFAVFMFGSVLESAWGPKRFLTYYIFTGVGAALTQYVVFYFGYCKTDMGSLRVLDNIVEHFLCYSVNVKRVVFIDFNGTLIMHLNRSGIGKDTDEVFKSLIQSQHFEDAWHHV